VWGPFSQTKLWRVFFAWSLPVRSILSRGISIASPRPGTISPFSRPSKKDKENARNVGYRTQPQWCAPNKSFAQTSEGNCILGFILRIHSLAIPSLSMGAATALARHSERKEAGPDCKTCAPPARGGSCWEVPPPVRLAAIFGAGQKQRHWRHKTAAILSHLRLLFLGRESTHTQAKIGLLLRKFNTS